MEKEDPKELFLRRIPQIFEEAFKIELPSPPSTFEYLKKLFSHKAGLFDKQVILLIDEFDKLLQGVITVKS